MNKVGAQQPLDVSVPKRANFRSPFLGGFHPRLRPHHNSPIS